MPAEPQRYSLAPNFIGSRRELTVWRFGKTGARPKVYLQAALHASEMTGVMALHHLVDKLTVLEAEGRIVGEVVVVPVANPIGLSEFIGGAQDGRFEQLSHANYNRGFPELSEAVAERIAGRIGSDPDANTALIRATVGEILAETPPHNEFDHLKRTLLALALDADVVLDFHSDRVAAMFMYINAIDWPDLSDLAAWLGSAATVAYPPYVPSTTFAGVAGSLFPRLAERFGPAIVQSCRSAMIEARGQNACKDSLGAADAENLVSFLVGRGVVEGTTGERPALLSDATSIEGMDVGYAPHPGFLTFHKGPGELIEKGDVVCDVIDPTRAHGNGRTRVAARGSGVLYARGFDGAVTYPGQVLFRIAGHERLAHRIGRSWLDD